MKRKKNKQMKVVFMKIYTSIEMKYREKKIRGEE